MKYLCVFSNATDLQSMFNWAEEGTAQVDCLSDVKDGFWVDKHCEFTKGGAAHVFVLPKSIKYIRKLTK